MFETMNDSKSLLMREIGKINAKGDISPSELDNLCKAYKTLREISTIEAMNGLDRSEGMRRNSYGYPYSYDHMPMGRPMSADQYRYERGYSGHSVNDRMIASLEREMDMAESEYDRNKIMEEIRRLREKKD